jgi:hypothetical protein
VVGSQRVSARDKVCEEVAHKHKVEDGKQCSPDSSVYCDNEKLLENGAGTVYVRPMSRGLPFYLNRIDETDLLSARSRFWMSRTTRPPAIVRSAPAATTCIAR